jgi:hypothetical protein
MRKLIMSRRRLFELVWAKPITQLALEFGMPPKHLAKACDRHDIPRPDPGHWQKLAYGKKLRTAELPQEHFGADSLVIVDIEEQPIGSSVLPDMMKPGWPRQRAA